MEIWHKELNTRLGAFRKESSETKKAEPSVNPAFFPIKLCVDLLLKLLSRSPETEQSRAQKEHGGGFGNGR
jgi:hypothetical protein